MQLGDGRAFFEAQVAGVSPELLQRVQRLAEQGTRCAVPLYILNYIWDGDELTAEQLQEIGIETALYSIHAAGVYCSCILVHLHC